MSSKGQGEQRYASVRRTARILKDLVKGKEHDRTSIAELSGLGVAAADRHIKELVKCPGVIAEKRGKRRVLRFDLSSLIPPPRFADVIAACLGTSLARVFEGSTYERNMRNALEYLVNRTRRQGAFAHIERKFLFIARGGEVGIVERSGLLDDAVDAVLHSKMVRVRYQRYHGEVELLDLQPLSIAVYDHQLYVIARGAGHAAYAYRFARIDSIEELHKTFEYPEETDYDPSQVFHDSFGIFISATHPVAEIKVRLSKQWAGYARTHRWHRSQRTERHADGTVTVHLRARTCPELEMWILGFGENAEVIEPADLRERIAARISVMARRYPTAVQLGLFPSVLGASLVEEIR